MIHWDGEEESDGDMPMEAGEAPPTADDDPHGPRRVREAKYSNHADNDPGDLAFLKELFGEINEFACVNMYKSLFSTPESKEWKHSSGDLA